MNAKSGYQKCTAGLSTRGETFVARVVWANGFKNEPLNVAVYEGLYPDLALSAVTELRDIPGYLDAWVERKGIGGVAFKPWRRR